MRVPRGNVMAPIKKLSEPTLKSKKFYELFPLVEKGCPGKQPQDEQG